jgi:hypothetical protein
LRYGQHSAANPMKPIAQWSKVSVLSMTLLSLMIVLNLGTFFAARDVTIARASPPASPGYCAGPAYHQFDFWAGDWDAFDVGSPVQVARARVDRILDGCVLHEDYRGSDGHHGESFTIYDASRKVWHQSWVTNRGELLVIEGTMEDDSMVLSGMDHAKGALVRGEWKPENGNVRETAATSTDGGKTWKPWFDLVFRRHP